MPSFDRRQLKAKHATHEVTSLAIGQRFAKLKAERAVSASADRPVLGEAIARRTAGRPWSKPGA
jgi:hypothetical protein